MHLATFLASTRNDRAIAAKAARQSLCLFSLSSHYLGTTPRRGFVLGFGNTKAKDIPQAVRHLRRLVETNNTNGIRMKQHCVINNEIRDF